MSRFSRINNIVSLASSSTGINTNLTTKLTNDLQKLCEQNVIPSQYHAWYASLPSTLRVLDLNPILESDSDETSE